MPKQGQVEIKLKLFHFELAVCCTIYQKFTPPFLTRDRFFLIVFLSNFRYQYLGNRFPELLEILCANSYSDKTFPIYQHRKLDEKNYQKKRDIIFGAPFIYI